MLLKLVMKLGGGSDKWKTENKDAKGHICSELMRMILVIMFV